MFKLHYKNYHIKFFNGVDKDNYDNVYTNQEEEKYRITSQHGIIVCDELGNQISSACVYGVGGGTGIHKNSAVISNDVLLICCGNSIFCLTLPSLKLLWFTIVDSASCFGIYQYQQDFIVHGECEISKINSEGKFLWQLSGPDIFTTPSGKEEGFTINNDIVFVKCWDGSKFEIDAKTDSLIQKI